MKGKTRTRAIAIEPYYFRHRIKKNFILAVTCGIFAFVYECFSHQVYSPFLIGAFLFPVLLGVIPDLVRMKASRSHRYSIKGGSLAIVLQQCGIYTLTAGSIFKGILDIYGTTNSNGVIYWWVGGGLFIGGIILQLVRI